jgi:hypothetical protein
MLKLYWLVLLLDCYFYTILWPLFLVALGSGLGCSFFQAIQANIYL